MLFKKIYNAGDKLEDKVRGRLSHHSIIYAFIGGIGVIIFWRGIWHTIDFVMEAFFTSDGHSTITAMSNQLWWDGPLCIIIGTIILLITGLFVTGLIGSEVIVSGLKKEKKIIEKTEEEIRQEIAEDAKINEEIHEINNRLKQIEEKNRK